VASRRVLAEHIEVGRRFLRSVNLEQDYVQGGPNGGYLVTANARQALDRVSEGLAEGSHARAWTITGPYGAGKSAFAVFLTRLMCLAEGDGEQARAKLLEVDPVLSERIGQEGVWANGTGGMLPVLVTARRAPASVCILQGLVPAVQSLSGPRASRLRKRVAGLLDGGAAGDPPDSREVVTAVQDAASIATSQGRWGLLVLVDELGKLFEYAARNPRRGDVFVLQELAEHASRSAQMPVLLLGCLHQSFEEYGQNLDLVTRREWEKIGGRFHDVPFLESPEQVVRMIADAIKPAGKPLPGRLIKRVEDIASSAADGIRPPGMEAEEFVETAVRAYPLHPVTLVALPYIFKRFAQNERSLFSYLSTLEPFGFQEFLATHHVNHSRPEFIRLPDLFDYFTANFGLGLYRHPQAKRWLEAVDVLERKTELTPLDVAVVKATGILNALGEFSHLGAHAEAISLSIADERKPGPAVRKSLEALREQSVLTYRAFNDTYRVWEGSDVDIEERIAEGQRKIRGDLRLAEGIGRYLPPRPLAARRHSFQTGALRFFGVGYVDEPNELTPDWKASASSDAHVAVCITSAAAQLEQFVDAAKRLTRTREDLLVAIPQEIGQIRAAVRELGALRWAWDATPDLRDDRVARREISLRISEAEQLLLRDLSGLLDPRPEPIGSECLWFYAGLKQVTGTPVAVSQLLSDVSDRLFCGAPRIRNELIARRSLSSAAAGARRSLIERMLTRAIEPLLGIEGYPPERSMYESVLEVTGLHREDESGAWGFHSPSTDSAHNLGPCWELLSGQILSAPTGPVAVAELFQALSRPPYGVPDGLHPVLLCAFMLAHGDETTLYREETFIPQYGIADFEVLMRRPELYAVAGVCVSGARQVVVERLAEGLDVKAATVPVVRALFARAHSLPEFAWQTKKLPAATCALRQAFADAKSPERLLFVELPGALELPPFSGQAGGDRQVAAFFDSLNQNLRVWAEALPSAVAIARDALLEACGFGAGKDGWQQLQQAAAQLAPSVTDTHLRAFVRRVLDAGTDSVGIESVLALVANRPPHSWADQDVERFPASAEVIAGQLVRALAEIEVTQSERTAIEGLSPVERKRAEELSGELRQILRVDTEVPRGRVLRAALMMLAEEIGVGDG